MTVSVAVIAVVTVVFVPAGYVGTESGCDCVSVAFPRVTVMF